MTHDFVGQDFTVVSTYQNEAGQVKLASINIVTPSRKFVLGVNGSVEGAHSHAEVRWRFIFHYVFLFTDLES